MPKLDVTMNKTKAAVYSISISLLTILFGANHGFSQINDTQFTTYENEELGISFQYPSNWSEMDEASRKQITELTKQMLSGQNLTANEKAYSESVSKAFILNPDPNNPLGVTLIEFEFPAAISVEEFSEIGLKLTEALGYKATVVDNTNITISNNEANKIVVRVDEGPAKGELTSVAFFNGNKVTNLQLGATNNEDQASIIQKVIDSIKITN
jgi:hypothetical protein